MYDVIVVGGGISGVSAAVCAARSGARVCLVEQGAMLGGLGTQGLVTVIISPEKFFGGFGREIIDELYRRGVTGPEVKQNVYSWVPFKGEGMKLLLDEKVTCEKNIDLFLYTKVFSCECENGIIKAVCAAAPEGNVRLEGRVFIDATGDGILSVMAGEGYESGDGQGNLQAPTMLAYYTNIDYEKYYAYFTGNEYENIEKMHALLTRAYGDGALSELDLHHPGAIRVGESMAVVNAGHLYGVRLDGAADYTSAVIAGRRQAAEYFEFYRRYVPGFENAVYVNTGSVLGTRETRRIKGKYTVTYGDKRDFVKFPDGVVRYKGGDSCDLHASSAEKSAYDRYFKMFTTEKPVDRDDFALLPYRCFLAEKNRNLMLAGRCVSTDRFVNAQNRVMGYCMMIGQAVGTAASMAAADGVSPEEIDIAALQKRLSNAGVSNL